MHSRPVPRAGMGTELQQPAIASSGTGARMARMTSDIARSRSSRGCILHRSKPPATHHGQCGGWDGCIRGAAPGCRHDRIFRRQERQGGPGQQSVQHGDHAAPPTIDHRRSGGAAIEQEAVRPLNFEKGQAGILFRSPPGFSNDATCGLHLPPGVAVDQDDRVLRRHFRLDIEHLRIRERLLQLEDREILRQIGALSRSARFPHTAFGAPALSRHAKAGADDVVGFSFPGSPPQFTFLPTVSGKFAREMRRRHQNARRSVEPGGGALPDDLPSPVAARLTEAPSNADDGAREPRRIDARDSGFFGPGTQGNSVRTDDTLKKRQADGSLLPSDLQWRTHAFPRCPLLELRNIGATLTQQIQEYPLNSRSLGLFQRGQ